MAEPSIRIAETNDEIMACFLILQEIRPHIEKENFIQIIRNQQVQGYQLVYLAIDTDIKTVAGFRFMQTLVSGKHLHVDDLCTRPDEQKKGYGQMLFDWLILIAKREHCAQIRLESGVQRHEAHRFYLRNQMRISSHHLVLGLTN